MNKTGKNTCKTFREKFMLSQDRYEKLYEQRSDLSSFGIIIILIQKNIMNNNAKPITKKEEVKENPDNKIDEDFKGYPHGHAKEQIIKPETDEEKKIADVDNKDGEKRIYKKNK